MFGEIPGGIVSYAAAVLNGVADGGSGDVDTNDGKDLVGRIVIRPFGPASTTAAQASPASGLTIAVAGTTGNQTGTLATYPDAIPPADVSQLRWRDGGRPVESLFSSGLVLLQTASGR